MSNPFAPPQSEVHQSPERGWLERIRHYKFRHWFRLICVFVLVTPVAIATILFVFALLGLVLGMGYLADSDHSRWVVAVWIVVSSLGGLYTGIKSAIETLPLQTGEFEEQSNSGSFST